MFSYQYNGKRFYNYRGEKRHGLKDVLKWKLSSKPSPWLGEDSAEPRAAPLRLGNGIEVSFIGHSSFLIQTPYGNFLTDPVYSNRVGPVSWFGPKRYTKPGVTWESLPAITAVLLSHDHYDHCDSPTLSSIAKRWNPIVATPLKMKGLLKNFSLVTELDWWQTTQINNQVSVTLVPAQHWGRRLPWDTNTRLWGGFYLSVAGRVIYFAGDSGYHETLFKTIKERLGSPDLSLIPIGAYEPRWFMKEAHMNPKEALQVHHDLGSKKSIGMHWGTFRLTDEGQEDPWLELGREMQEKSLPQDAFIVLKPGQSISLPGI